MDKLGYDNLLQELVEHSNNGKQKRILDRLAQLELTQIPETHRLHFATLARNAGTPLSALKILNGKELNGSERVLYAASLIDLGAYQEAIRRLLEERSDYPIDVLYFHGLALTKSWNCQAAVPLLEMFLHNSPASPLHILAKQSLILCYTFLGNFTKAQEHTDASPELHDERALLACLHTGHSPHNDTFSSDMRRLLALYGAIRQKDASLAATAFYGSPFDSFRNRCLELFGSQILLPEHYEYHFNVSPAPGARYFDLSRGFELQNDRVKLKIGQALHRLFLTLGSDFYRPFRLGTLFEQVFIGETFDPFTSPSRVHQIVKRLKQWFATSQIPLHLKESKGCYFLQADGAYTLLFSRKHLHVPSIHPLYARLQLSLPNDAFSIRQAANSLGLSKRFARKVLERAEKEGWIIMKGRGKLTKYEFR